MTDRRTFLKGILALGVVSAVPMPAFGAIPRIYSDGVRDDAPGLQAMLDGNPFLVESEQVVASDGLIKGGDLVLKTGLRFPSGKFGLYDNRILFEPAVRGTPLIEVLGSESYVSVIRNTVTLGPAWSTSWSSCQTGSFDQRMPYPHYAKWAQRYQIDYKWPAAA